MLKLDYQEGNVITIGTDIEIHLYQTRDGEKKIGIQAPKHLYIGRRKSLKKWDESKKINGFS